MTTICSEHFCACCACDVSHESESSPCRDWDSLYLFCDQCDSTRCEQPDEAEFERRRAAYVAKRSK